MSEKILPQRIAKIIARSGLCSRRDAERRIEQGRITVDGKVITSPAFDVDDPQRVTVDGKALPNAEPSRLWAYHKPKGLITTHYDPEGRPTVFKALPFEGRHIISIGRLDLFSEGLLLLTNDGSLARHLEHPSMGWKRSYRVLIEGRVTQDMLNTLKAGVTIEGIHYREIEAKLEKRQGFSHWVTFVLREGKNREIRKIIEYLGWKVTRLIRQTYGPFNLGALQPGEVKEVPRNAVLKIFT
ncbi:MAG: rRNA pseudouridine synthase [Alphaproteobacteria bacterium]|nr:rRNA pseudouridine synthase [Alphaproteobacteria bacterium]